MKRDKSYRIVKTGDHTWNVTPKWNDHVIGTISQVAKNRFKWVVKRHHKWDSPRSGFCKKLKDAGYYIIYAR